MLAARDQHRAPQHDERPQRRDLVVGQRHDRVERPDRRQHTERLVGVVAQDGRAGDGEVGDQPAPREVPEVDDAVRSQPARRVGSADHVVVGHVAVDRLDAEPLGHGGEPLGGGRGDVGHQCASLRVGDGGQQRTEDLVGAAQVPLHDAVEAGMLEVGEGRAGPAGQRAEVGDDRRREVDDVGQRLTLDVGEQPQRQYVVAVGHLVHEGAVQPGEGHRRGESRVAPRDVHQRGVLGGDGLAAPRPVRDLEDAPSVGRVDAEVAVLVAAELADRPVDAVDLAGQLRGARDVDPGARRDLERLAGIERHGRPQEWIPFGDGSDRIVTRIDGPLVNR